VKNFALFFLIGFLMMGCSSFQARDLSQKSLSIADCPSSPNCVSSQSKSDSHKVEPFKFVGSIPEFHKLAERVQTDLPRTQIIRIEGPYVHFVVTSKLFRFKDDVEFYFLESESLIHVRSASRLGYSDLGANRARVELIAKIVSQFQVPKKNPLVIGHRGASGHRPEHTLEAYQLAIEMGADFIEPDLVSTKDGVLIARHENEISETTDVAKKFPTRKATKIIDGQSITGWFTEDFTLEEIKTLTTKERLSFRNQKYNGQFQIPTFEEILNLAKTESEKRKRSIGIYPETKHPSYFQSLKLPLDQKLIEVLRSANLDRQKNPIFIQSFEPTILQTLKTQTTDPLILLIGDLTEVPYDLKQTTNKMTYQQLLSENSLNQLKNYISGIGFHKSHLLNSDLVERAHQQNLLVHVYTFRSDKTYLDSKYQGRPELEYMEFFKLGVDGVFSDFPDDAIKARSQY
jgi:glycerophosphoryl diester phosphodiesterase